jgi:hypothetical protein
LAKKASAERWVWVWEDEDSILLMGWRCKRI